MEKTRAGPRDQDVDGLPSPLIRDSILRAVGLGSPTLNIRRHGPLDARSIHRLQVELKKVRMIQNNFK